jgi:HK97 gp10 family phage protein
MDIEFEIDTGDLKANLDAYEKEVTDRVNRGIEAAAAIIAELVKSETPKGATLALYHSITYQDVTPPGSETVEYLIGVDGNSSAAKYASDVEYGAPPHDVSIEELIPWVRSKGMPDEAAYAIAKVIKEQGTQAHPFLFHTVEENKNIIIREIERAMNGP